MVGLRRKRISQVDALEFLDSIKELPIHLADPVSYDDVFGLADRHGLTVYDAAYLDCAIREGLPLASLDNALRKAAIGWRGPIPAIIGAQHSGGQVKRICSGGSP